MYNCANVISHPGPSRLFAGQTSDSIAGVLMNARKEIHCEFIGKSAHAGGNPWEGVNALDALVSSYNNVSVLRQQLQPDERIHCAFLDTPKVANVIPSYTKAYWQVRSPSLKGLNTLMAKVRNCIEAAGLATGCEAKLVEYVTMWPPVSLR
jgi:metal-dependent amidase/aminoacylase/carboxypeptidase family protein